MDVSGSHTFAAPRERVWNVLLDPDALRASLPSTKEFREVAADDYEATMSVGIGAIKGTYSGKVQVRDKEPPTRYRLLVEGKRGHSRPVHWNGHVALSRSTRGPGQLMADN